MVMVKGVWKDRNFLLYTVGEWNEYSIFLFIGGKKISIKEVYHFRCPNCFGADTEIGFLEYYGGFSNIPKSPFGYLKIDDTEVVVD